MRSRRINSKPGGTKRDDAELTTPEKAKTRTMQRAVKLLAAKSRSVAELRERLLEKCWTNETIVDEVLAKLKEYGYLNDEQFAFGFASYRVKQSPIGRRRLARDLQMKKVDQEIADEALRLVFDETPEEGLIDRAIRKRTRLRGLPRTRPEIKSFIDHLLRLGFSYDLVTNRVRTISKADFEEDDLP
jgi:regulatory protein